MIKIDYASAIRALEHFLELTQADRRDRAIDPLIGQLESTMSSSLRRQGEEFRRGMRGLKSKWQDDGRLFVTDWLPYLQGAQNATREQTRDGFFANVLQSLVLGAGHMVDDIGMPMTIAFGLNDPLAIDYARSHAARQLKKVDASTLEGVNRTITKGVEEGYSYTRLQKELQTAYAFSKERARNIAVFEVGDAYEGGRRKAVDDMRSQGLQMVKSWLTVGDSKVRPDHIANQAQGWIDVDEPFEGDGAMRPPTDPRCRCTTLYQRGVPPPKTTQAPIGGQTYVVTCNACGATYRCSGPKEYERTIGTGHGKCPVKPKGKWSVDPGLKPNPVDPGLKPKPVEVPSPTPTSTPQRPKRAVIDPGPMPEPPPRSLWDSGAYGAYEEAEKKYEKDVRAWRRVRKQQVDAEWEDFKTWTEESGIPSSEIVELRQAHITNIRSGGDPSLTQAPLDIATGRYRALESELSERLKIPEGERIRPIFAEKGCSPAVNEHVENVVHESSAYVHQSAHSFKSWVLGEDPGTFRIGWRALPEGRNRPYASGEVINILDEVGWDNVITHEMGHIIETSDKFALDASHKFIKRRTEGEALRPLGGPYGRDEVTRPDDFIDPYVGKSYGKTATEVISMGIDWMVHDPVTLYTRDPDMFEFMFKVLRGGL